MITEAGKAAEADSAAVANAQGSACAGRMLRAITAVVLACTLLAAADVRAAADATPKLSWKAWHIYGSETFRFDGYNAYGDRTSSPYPFTGIQTYDNLNLGFERTFTPYNRVSGQVSGLLYNDSKYRSPFQGVVPERLDIKQENGAFFIPYRVKAGDFFAFQSYRTIMRSLKGVQVEFQPNLGGGTRNSIVLFSGGGSPAWRSFQLKDDWSNGASWLIQHPVYGRISANLVFNHKKANQAAGLQSSRQYVYSLAYEKHGVWSTRWSWLAQRLTVEGEAGRFVGNRANVTGAGSGRNRHGNGYFAQISGSPIALAALGYRVRFEAYDQDYRPNGGNIQPDRRSEEGHLSWRFASGLTVRTRVQNFRTAWKTSNPSDTLVYGVNLSGPVAGLSMSLDAFRQRIRNRDQTTNVVARSVNASLSKGISRNVSARTGFFYSNTHDRTDPTTGVHITRQLSADMDFRVGEFGFAGTVSPGFLMWRLDTQGGMTNWNFNPTLNINASRGPHTFSLSFSARDQGRPQNDLGVTTRTAGLNYSYRQKRYTVGVEGDWYARNPDNATLRRTDAWRLGMFLTINFDKPARAGPASVPEERASQTETPALTTPASAVAAPSSTARFALDITNIKPGMSEADVRKIVAAAEFGKPVDQAGYLVWFARIMRDIDQRQRLAVDVVDGTVSRVALVIDFNDVGNAADVQQIFERVRQQVLEQYGQPDTFFDQGNFGPNLGVDLAASHFIRVMEWKRKSGTLRFGIPRRLDGKVRMELQFARSFPPLNHTLWSIGAVQ